MPATPENLLALGNDYDVGFPAGDDKLALRSTGAAVTGATVTAQLFASDRTTNIGSAVTLTDDGAGAYSGVIESSVFAAQTADTVVYCKWAASSSGKDATWWKRLVVGYREPGE
jgi:hypothetical protein